MAKLTPSNNYQTIEQNIPSVNHKTKDYVYTLPLLVFFFGLISMIILTFIFRNDSFYEWCYAGSITFLLMFINQIKTQWQVYDSRQSRVVGREDDYFMIDVLFSPAIFLFCMVIGLQNNNNIYEINAIQAAVYALNMGIISAYLCSSYSGGNFLIATYNLMIGGLSYVVVSCFYLGEMKTGIILIFSPIYAIIAYFILIKVLAFLNDLNKDSLPGWCVLR